MKLLSKLHIRLNCYKENLIFAKRFLCVPGKKRIILMQTPEHNNIGDSALVVAELHFFSDYFGDTTKVVEITRTEYDRFKKIIKLCLNKKDIVTIHAGGNMGNVWHWEEACRRDIINTFTQNKIVSLPQTMYYEDNVQGSGSLKASIEIYSQHKNLILTAREKYSYELMKTSYKKNEVVLTPDMAIYLHCNISKRKRNGILLCLRNDVEKKINSDDILKITNAICGRKYEFTDMYSEEYVNKDNRSLIVAKKMEQFAESELIITDRLHGMVFAAITETPCVVMSNNNHKVKGVYEWIKDLEYIEFIDNVEELSAAIENVMSVKDRHYSNERFKPYFEQIVKAIDEV